MSMMNLAMPYQSNQGMAFTRIVRRPLTDAEKQLGVGYYKKVQMGLRGLAAICLVLFILNTFVLSDVSDLTISILLTVFMIVFGLVAVGMSVNVIVIRKKVSDVLREGMAIEVSGPAYMTGGAGKVPSWTVGPVSLVVTREAMGMLQQGAQVSIVCLPKLKVAVAINGYGLKHGIRVMFPPNLEAMAVPSGPAVVAAMPQK